MGKQKILFKKSIASSSWSYQPDQVALVDKDLAAAWVHSGVAVRVNGDMPITALDALAD